MIQSENIGLLWVGRQNPITPAEMRLMDSIGEIAANAIQRETSHEQLVQQVQRLSALRMIDAAISNSFDLRLTLDVILDQAALQLKADAVAVLLLNHSTLLLEYAAGRGFRDRAIEHVRVRLGEGLAGRAAFEQRTLSIHNLAADADLSRIPLFQREGFCLHHVTPLIAKGQTKGVLEVFQRSEQDPTPDWLTFFETLAAQTAIAIDNIHLFDGLQRSNIELSLAYDATIEGWSRALDMRDRETEGHTQRVAEFTVRLARAQGMREEEIVHIHRGSLLHDIGKMAIPDSILLKPKPLTDEEWVLMRKHPQFAYDMLYPIEYLRPALEIPYCHHEKMDGSGYPRGLKGEAIPQSARLFAVVDVWDALRSDRPYRKAWNEEKVLEYIATSTGAHFDPKAVELFFSIIRQGASGKR
jgi:HD-GYP domain-containing protein (c-di-GMP phosphodiesterase class II)